MRPPRIVIIVAFLLTTFFLTFLSLRSSHPPQTVAASTSTPKAGIQSLFSFRAPFSLFPPNAIITLTNDNTTAFLARPAAFGPLLPNEGLKGQLWIGSGFGDDSIRQGPVASGAEGELGCSDVPGWVDNYAKSGAAEGAKSGDDKSATAASKSKTNKRASKGDKAFTDRTSSRSSTKSKHNGVVGPSVNDGTDDYLHHPLPGSTVSKLTDKQPADIKANHADIQSIQEGAEIAGKVVLLSRGGCGFLEKVKWVQRRGGIALIVGDDKSGGPLIQMYARGDTSNVTIPAIFTSRTTAHLLSSLIGPGTFNEDALDEMSRATLKVQKSDKSKKVPKKKKTKESQPTFTATAAMARATTKAAKKSSAKFAEKTKTIKTQKPGWFKSLFYGAGGRGSVKDSSRPPSSGQLDWVLVDDWKDDDNAGTKKISTAKLNGQEKVDADKKSQKSGKGGNKPSPGDDFVIGVQDWRDPDLVGSSDDKNSEKSSKIGAAKTDGKSDANKAKNESPQPMKAGTKNSGGITEEKAKTTPKLRGGSITPGSGEYAPKLAKAKEMTEKSSSSGSKTKSILTTIFGDDEEDFEFLAPGSSSTGRVDIDDEIEEDDNEGEYEENGLWVTLTPTSGASPFLDTLLVLVVSPLVTLTVVYALLLLRSRIRRRRWRAPKSVVERLPVRTYQTINNTPGNRSPTMPSPTSSSPTTPLLSHTTPSRPRPRSRTTTGIPEAGDIARVNSNPLQVPTLTPLQPNEHEKNSGSPSQWKKYMGKQVECVVCLEEYVDGVSQVMSLPCGHEFHVDCITPWLTTRRRTCPICKGDVVRSLARGSPSSPRYEAYHDDDSDDDIQAQAAETVNTSSSSTRPISRNIEDDIAGDLEQGISPPTPTRTSRSANRRGESWRIEVPAGEKKIETGECL
ncbi:hypothetical protein DSL72_006344 [Monilinia vaccinii-corymbosi]|uniref:RING-type domain-containing protein n=1 Tax=Monilinia vaccinii-corymbosi TaxID=61207 RepID=A0A8A3PNF5_9HELO|nr:hypothetical protein DSL72_006344 [Monilinia vaccinii-corymbosi]